MTWAYDFYDPLFSFKPVVVRKLVTGNYIVGGMEGTSVGLVILDPSGNLLQNEALYTMNGNSWGLNQITDLKPMSDGGWVMAGWYHYYVNDQHIEDAFVARFDGSGSILWEKSYAGPSTDRAYAIQILPGGQFAVAGTYTEDTGEVAWFFELDASGNLIRQWFYPDSGITMVYSLLATADGGFLLSGTTAGTHDNPIRLPVLLKLDSQGRVEWQKTYVKWRWPNADPTSMLQTEDGGFIVAGMTYISTGVNGDLWVLRIDPQGEVVWGKVLNGWNTDYDASVVAANNGGVVLSGITSSFGTQIFSLWMVAFDQAGNVSWQKAYTPGQNAASTSVVMDTAFGDGYFAAGDLTSDGFWFLKTDENGNLDPACSFVQTSDADTDDVQISVDRSACGETAGIAMSGDLNLSRLDTILPRDLYCTSGPYVNWGPSGTLNPLRTLKMRGGNFHPDVKVFFGDSTKAWTGVKKTSSEIVLSGAGLKSKFPKGVPVRIWIRNGDGTATYVLFTR
jgi:hypothetical protein